MTFWPVYANLPLLPRVARHFPPHSGEATAKEERNYIFYISQTKEYWNGSHKKLSPFVGKQANHFSRSGATLQKCVWRFALAKVAAVAVGRGKREQKGKRVFYKTILNTCLSFLNEVMASEPFSGERSNTVKMSETPYPTNGSGKNLGKECEY